MSRSSVSEEVEKHELEKEASHSHVNEQGDDLEPSSSAPRSLNGNDVEKDGATLTLVESKPSISNVKSVPNGGTKAWLQVCGAFFVFFNTWGILNSFGIYQTFYEADLLRTSSPSDISWIGSIEAFALLFAGLVTGPIYDKGYAHELLLVGSFLIVLGQMMIGLCHEYWQVFLAQGICLGIGMGCLFVSAVAILSTYFTTKLATATGLAAAGSSIGGMLYPIIFHKLQPHIGFPWTTRVLGFITLATLAVSNIVLRVRVIPATRRKFFDFPAWKEAPYVCFTLGTTIAFIGLYAPFYYIQLYCLETNIMSANLAFYTLAVLNAASTFGRIIPNLIADHIGPLNVLLPCAFVCGILQYCLIVTRSTASVMVVIALYGFFSGTLVSLPGTIYVHLAGPKNRSLIGTRMGMGFAIAGFGVLIGTPVSGAILNATKFEYVWIFGGTALIIASVLLALTRLTQGQWKLWVKV